MPDNRCQPLTATLAGRFFWTVLACWAALCAIFATLIAPMLNFAIRPLVSIAIVCGFLLIGLFTLTLLMRRTLLRPIGELTTHILTDDPITDPDWPAVADACDNDEIGRLRQAIVTARTRLIARLHHVEQSNAHLHAELADRRRIDHQHQEVIQLVELSNHSLETINKRLERQHAETQNLLTLAADQIQPELAEIVEAADALIRAAALTENTVQKNELQRIRTAAKETLSLLACLAGHNGARSHIQVAVDLNGALAEALADLDLKIQRVDADIAHSPLPTIYGDPAEITLLIYILIDNALRTRSLTHRPTVRITAQRLKPNAPLPDACDPTLTYHRITFTDNGTGFAEDQHHQLFSMLRSRHPADELGHPAMALPLAYALVAKQGGTLIAQSIPGQTTTFDIYWPTALEHSGTSNDTTCELACHAIAA